MFGRQIQLKRAELYGPMAPSPVCILTSALISYQFSIIFFSQYTDIL